MHVTCFLKVMCQIHCPICMLIAKEINCHLKSFPGGKRTDLYLCQGHLCSMRKQLPYSTGEHLERQVLTCGYLSRFIQAEVYAETRDDWYSHFIIQRLNYLSSRVWELVFTVFDKDGSIFLFKYNFRLPVPKSDFFFLNVAVFLMHFEPFSVSCPVFVQIQTWSYIFFYFPSVLITSEVTIMHKKK